MTRDARVRDAITDLLDVATGHGLAAVAVKDLGFATQESSRERYGRNRAFRALVQAFTRGFRSRLVGMADRRGVAVVAVDPRYTSVVGARDWTPLLSSTSRPVTGHEGAAVTIGRRGLALPLRAHRAAAVRPVSHRRMEAAATSSRGGGTDTRTTASSAGRADTAAAGKVPARPPHPRRASPAGVAARVSRETRRPPSRRIGVAGTTPAPTPAEAGAGVDA